jgi:hypothetical protein
MLDIRIHSEKDIQDRFWSCQHKGDVADEMPEKHMNLKAF